MNPKIREFIQRSYPEVDLEKEINSNSELPVEAEKLVEMVIDECCKVCGRTPTVWPFAYMEFKKVIRKHFGLD